MRSGVRVALFSLIILANQVCAREPIPLRLPAGALEFKIEDASLLASRDGRNWVSISGDLKHVTNFAVTEWNDRQGAALAIETHGFGESRSYRWMTVRVDQERPASTGTNLDQSGLRVLGTGPILENIDPLTILSLRSSGDGIHIILCDPSGIPDSDRKLAFRFQHDCAITPKPNLGRSRRLFLTPTAIKTISKEATQQIWNADSLPAPQ